MLKIDSFKIEYFDRYINLYNEFIKNNSDLVPDVLELPCRNINDYEKILNEIEKRKIGNHEDTEWYKNAYYYLIFDEKEIIGLGCIRCELTKLGSDVWGNIAIGVRPTQRKKGYATKIIKLLLEECKRLGMKEVIACHYVTNKITPKILNKIGAKFTNNIKSEYSGKEIKRYVINLEGK